MILWAIIGFGAVGIFLLLLFVTLLCLPGKVGGWTDDHFFGLEVAPVPPADPVVFALGWLEQTAAFDFPGRLTDEQVESLRSAVPFLGSVEFKDEDGRKNTVWVVARSEQDFIRHEDAR